MVNERINGLDNNTNKLNNFANLGETSNLAERQYGPESMEFEIDDFLRKIESGETSQETVRSIKNTKISIADLSKIKDKIRTSYIPQSSQGMLAEFLFDKIKKEFLPKMTQKDQNYFKRQFAEYRDRNSDRSNDREMFDKEEDGKLEVRGPKMVEGYVPNTPKRINLGNLLIDIERFGKQYGKRNPEKNIWENIGFSFDEFSRSNFSGSGIEKQVNEENVLRMICFDQLPKNKKYIEDIEEPIKIVENPNKNIFDEYDLSVKKVEGKNELIVGEDNIISNSKKSKIKRQEEYLNDMNIIDDKSKEKYNAYLKRYNINKVELLKKLEKDPKLCEIFDKLLENNFNFSKLDDQEKTVIANKFLLSKLEKAFGILETNIPSGGKSEMDYKLKIAKELCDFTKDSIIELPDDTGEIRKIKIKKDFKDSDDLSFLLNNSSELPVEYSITGNEFSLSGFMDSVNIIDYNKLGINRYHVNTGFVKLENGRLDSKSIDITKDFLVEANGYEGYFYPEYDVFTKTSEKELKELQKKQPEIFDESGAFAEDQLILCNEKGKPIKDTNGKFIVINEEVENKNVDIKIRKQKLKIDNKLAFSNVLDLTTLLRKTETEAKKLNSDGKITKQQKAKAPDTKLTNTSLGETLGHGKPNSPEKVGTIQDLNSARYNNDINETLGEPKKDPNQVGEIIDSDQTKVRNYFRNMDTNKLRSKIEQNVGLGDEIRTKQAEINIQDIARQLGIDFDLLNPTQTQAILDAHYSTRISKTEFDLLNDEKKENYIEYDGYYYEKGNDGNVAGIYINNKKSNYTKTQLRAKADILDKAGILGWQKEIILRLGFSGIDGNQFNKKNNENLSKELNDLIVDSINNGELLGDQDNGYFVNAPEALVDRLTDLDKKDKSKILSELKSDSNIEKLKEKVNLEDYGQDFDFDDLVRSFVEHLEDESKIKGPEAIDPEDEIKDPKKALEEEWNKIPGVEGCNLEAGTVLLFKDKSKIKPMTASKDTWDMLTIEKVDDNFIYLRANGGELKLDGIEGNTFKVPKTADYLESIAGNVTKVPKHENDLSKAMLNISNSQILLKNGGKESFLRNTQGDIQAEKENGRWVFKKTGRVTDPNEKKVNEPMTVNYFAFKDTTVVAGSQKRKNIDYIFKVDYNKDGTITVKSEFSNMEYKKTMDYHTFLTFVLSKKLQPYGDKDDLENSNLQTDKKGNSEDMRSPMHGRGEFLSIGALIGGIKNGYKTIETIIKEKAEGENEKFENVLFGLDGLDLYGKLANVVGLGGIWGGGKDAMLLAQAEFYGKRDERVWKKIEKWYSIFEKDPHASTLWHTIVKPILQDGKYLKKNNKYKEKFAAALLQCVRKEGPYAQEMQEFIGQGRFVNAMLGPAHRKTFLEYKRNMEIELEQYKDAKHIHWRKKKQTELNRLEIDYLIGVIDGRKPYQDDDEHYRASVWSRGFTDKLEENAKGMFGGDFENKLNGAKEQDFRKNEAEFYRLACNNRLDKGLPHLAAMFSNAQSDEECQIARGAFMSALLSGSIHRGMGYSARNMFWKIARTVGFVPGLSVRDTDSQLFVSKLLDLVTDGSFSKETGYDMNMFTGKKGSQKYFGDFMRTGPKDGSKKGFKNFWEDKGEEIWDIISFNDTTSKNNLFKLKEEYKGNDRWVVDFMFSKANEPENEDMEQSCLYCYEFFNSPFGINRGAVSALVPSSDGKWKADKDTEEACEIFWGSVATKLPKRDFGSEGNSNSKLTFFLKKYKNWMDCLGDPDWDNFAKTIKLVQYYKEQGLESRAKYYFSQATYSFWKSKLNGFPEQFEQAMEAFFKTFYENIQYIDSDTVTEALGAQYIHSFDRPYVDSPIGEFKNKVMNSEGRGMKVNSYNDAYMNDVPREDMICYKILDNNRRAIGGKRSPTNVSIDKLIAEEKRLGTNTKSTLANYNRTYHGNKFKFHY